MLDRRRHTRFTLTEPWLGTASLLWDITLRVNGDDELTAISHRPGQVDETLNLDVIDGSNIVSLRVVVLASRPVIVDGAVRHELRLAVQERATVVEFDRTSAALGN